jgi:trimethylamine:corrinoid methyltransferase-like protein
MSIRGLPLERWSHPVVDDETLAAIHAASLRVLARTGVAIDSPRLRAALGREGALLDRASDRVRLPADMETRIAGEHDPKTALFHKRRQTHGDAAGDAAVFDAGWGHHAQIPSHQFASPKPFSLEQSFRSGNRLGRRHGNRSFSSDPL